MSACDLTRLPIDLVLFMEDKFTINCSHTVRVGYNDYSKYVSVTVAYLENSQLSCQLLCAVLLFWSTNSR